MFLKKNRIPLCPLSVFILALHLMAIQNLISRGAGRPRQGWERAELAATCGTEHRSWRVELEILGSGGRRKAAASRQKEANEVLHGDGLRRAMARCRQKDGHRRVYPFVREEGTQEEERKKAPWPPEAEAMRDGWRPGSADEQQRATAKSSAWRQSTE